MEMDDEMPFTVHLLCERMELDDDMPFTKEMKHKLLL